MSNQTFCPKGNEDEAGFAVFDDDIEWTNTEECEHDFYSFQEIKIICFASKLQKKRF